jgi:hypothetical protein
LLAPKWKLDMNGGCSGVGVNLLCYFYVSEHVEAIFFICLFFPFNHPRIQRGEHPVTWIKIVVISKIIILINILGHISHITVDCRYCRVGQVNGQI